jgi:hypothetical protein
MDMSLWYGIWSGVLCGLWFGAGITVLKLRQEGKQWASREAYRPSSEAYRPMSSPHRHA